MVVVLPSEPVTATISQGQKSKKSSTSLVTMVPAAMAACSGLFKVAHKARRAHDDVLARKPSR